MKKVTEEQVSALIAGLERREREALADRHVKTASESSGPARILPLKRRAKSGDVVPINKCRRERLKRTVSGMFLYSAARA